MTSAPRVVALGGGHGTAVTLRATRRYASELTAVVSVADDGGSSGRLRDLLGVPALGDLRKCLVALSKDDSLLAVAMEHRYEEGELAGHALGNLILAGLIDALHGDLVAGVDEAAHLLGVEGRVLPATTHPVALQALVGDRVAVGQVAVGLETAISSVRVVPSDAVPPVSALDAIAAADQIVIGPGSLFTSVLAAAVVPGIPEALARSSARRVFVCNLRPEMPETAGYSVADHLDALRRHGIAVDLALIDPAASMQIGESPVEIAKAELAGSNGLVHDPVKLATALQDLLA